MNRWNMTVSTGRVLRRAAQTAASALGIGAATYAGVAAVTWFRFGQVTRSRKSESASMLDQFMPTYEVMERHKVSVKAPCSVTLDAARELDLLDSPVIRGIFRAREVFLGSQADASFARRGLLAQMQAIGWRVLAEDPNHEIVAGAATQPWIADPIFRPIPADAFRAFCERDNVKIVWNLRVEPEGEGRSIFHTETRALSTDEASRKRFRTYWAWVMPGVWLIRSLSLGPLKKEAERRYRVSQDAKKGHLRSNRQLPDARFRPTIGG